MPYVHVLTNLAAAPPTRQSICERRTLKLSTIARRRGLDVRRSPTLCQYNGRWISQSQWRRVTARENDVVIFVVMPRDTGTVKTVASLAVILIAAVATPYLLEAGLIVGAGGLFAAGSTGAYAATALTTAALVIGGNYLLNAIIPVRPVASSPLSASDSSASNQTYAPTIGSRQNLPRLDGSIPVLYGRMRFTPDLAATPWTQWVANTTSGQTSQFLHQVMVLTQGEMVVEKIELGSTPIDTFEEVSYEVVPPYGFVSMFPTQVYQNPDVREIVMLANNEIVAGLGDGVDDGIYGPFAVCPPGQISNRIGIDIGFPQGLFYVRQSDGFIGLINMQWLVEFQQIDDYGNPITAWTQLAIESFVNGAAVLNACSYQREYFGGSYNSQSEATSPLHISYRYTFASTAAARYQVRCRRSTNRIMDLHAAGYTQCGDQISWSGLRGELTHTGEYGGVTVLAMRIRGSHSLNEQTIRQISVTGTRKLAIYNTGTASWSATTATRDIAPAIADMVLNAYYGGKRSARDIDLDGLFGSLHPTWQARTDTFDYYCSQPITLMAAVSLAARSGRAVPYHQSGVLRFHRDQPQTVPVQMFSRENIVRGTFKQTFIMPSPADETDGVEVKFLDQATWLQNSIRIPRPSVVESTNPTSNNLDGVVSLSQANNEANYMLAADQYRRIFVEFDTELEGMIPSHGDLVLIAHDAPRWGLAQRVYQYDSGTRTVSLWNSLDLPDDADPTEYFVMFRDRRGRPSLEVQVSSFVDELTIVLSTAATYADTTPFDFTASDSEPLQVVIGTSNDVPKRALFLSAVPRGNKRVSVRCVLEDDRVHVN